MIMVNPWILQSGKICDLGTDGLSDPEDRIVTLRFFEIGEKPLPECENLEPDEADKLAELLKSAAAAARKVKIDAFLKRFDGWEGVINGTAPQPDIRANSGRSCGTPGLGMMMRDIKMLRKHLDDGVKSRIRLYFSVNESYQPPLVNM